MKRSCILCGGELEYVYNLNDYKIVQCKSCRTACVENMPDGDTLKEYYKGFNYCINEDNLPLIVNNDFKKWFESYHLPQNARMLDIGGGNGYFSLAFEKYEFGKATYIDLDSEACEYVKTLGISNVINGDIKNLAGSSEKFDFIYSRHVIEHLTNPLPLIEQAIDSLSQNGVFVLQMPNGLSLEQLIEPSKLENKYNILKSSNNFSNLKILRILHSKETANDIAPPRHLWAFSKKGIKSFLEKIDGIEFKIRTYGSKDKVYSPYLYNHSKKFNKYPIKKLLVIIKSLLRFFYCLPGGKSHLVVEIRKKVQK